MRYLAVLLACSAVNLLPAGAYGTELGPALTVQMKDARGDAVGTVEIRQLQHGAVFTADLSNLPAGPHGFHVHERGVCEAPDFQSAGAHFNPTKAEHGFEKAQGYHMGDLPNMHVMQDGTAMAEMHVPHVTLELGAQPANAEAGAGLFGLRGQDGAAVVIHEKGDDYKTSDSAGKRIACGVIAPPK